MNKKILITGAMGFIGSHLIEGVLKQTNWDIVVLDRLDISGNISRLTDIEIWEKEKHRVKFVWWDLKAELNDFVKKEIGEVNYIWHLAASSHVDRSIKDPMSFVMDNVVGTCNLLNYARTIYGEFSDGSSAPLEQFVYFSTDEIFGAAPEGVNYKEWDRYKSGNPYAASKAGAEELCVAFENTYRLPIIITHTMNCGGEKQHPEKFIPSTIRKVYLGETVIIHSDKDKKKSGTRFYIHAREICNALLFLIDKGKIGEKYNIVGEREISNLQLAEMIARIMGKPLKYEMTDFHSERPGHDLRYALSGKKMKKMGWEPKKYIQEWLGDIINWSLEPKNQKWLGM